MKSAQRELVKQCQSQQQQEERRAFFAEAMCMNKAETETAIGTAKPLALETTSGWTAALWLKPSHDLVAGELIGVAEGCRTRKLALITANYYRLHHMLNQANNRTNISPSF